MRNSSYQGAVSISSRLLWTYAWVDILTLRLAPFVLEECPVTRIRQKNSQRQLPARKNAETGSPCGWAKDLLASDEELWSRQRSNAIPRKNQIPLLREPNGSHRAYARGRMPMAA